MHQESVALAEAEVLEVPPPEEAEEGHQVEVQGEGLEAAAEQQKS
mgnify:CR=1 FL=1|tara:strand:+ start:1185 stop:1319 length:135 start_codon:yes stop_codon:yes gene_type:complete